MNLLEQLFSVIVGDCSQAMEREGLIVNMIIYERE